MENSNVKNLNMNFRKKDSEDLIKTKQSLNLEK